MISTFAKKKKCISLRVTSVDIFSELHREEKLFRIFFSCIWSIAMTEERFWKLKMAFGIVGIKLLRRFVVCIYNMRLTTWIAETISGDLPWGEERGTFYSILPGLCLKAFVRLPIIPPFSHTLLPFLSWVTWLDGIRGMMFVDFPSSLPLLHSLACWNSVEVKNVKRRPSLALH